ncbi:hypothetical protein FIBSPDRAFT_850210 [Athelia psychrophila]|uniref:Uncharacterized protein n=1 Tax=Athelia psychrophila TaxID=1759441 RepID=A0A166TLX5_9AGAM|nr:hypothetical protein FIBSPDRAFT_850210 [Fibularhizoctonia sp. CBS 109695]
MRASCSLAPAPWLEAAPITVRSSCTPVKKSHACRSSIALALHSSTRFAASHGSVLQAPLQIVMSLRNISDTGAAYYGVALLFMAALYSI